MRVAKIVAVIVLVPVVGIPVLLGLIWLDHFRETTLPQPTGPFAVGRTTYVWNEPTNTDPLPPEPGTGRELLAWIWYPAAPTQPSQATSDYLPPSWRSAVEHQRGTLLTQFLTRDLSRVRTHSTRDAALSAQQPPYPVVVMRAGLSGLVTGYTSLAEDLASHGYVVVGFDAPYRSSVVVFPDGRVIERAPLNNLDALGGPEQEQRALELVHAWSADIGFALDQLERLNESDPSGKFLGRLDMQRVGVFGHSLGGATALQFCHDDGRCKAGIDVDGAPLGSVIAEGVAQPFMFLLSDHSREPESETRPIKANIRSIYDRQPDDRRIEIVIRGANHYMFSDDGAMLKSPLLLRVMRMLGIVRLDGRRQVAITTHYTSTFFDVYLKGRLNRSYRTNRGFRRSNTSADSLVQISFFLSADLEQHSLKTNQLSGRIGTSPEGTAESSPARTGFPVRCSGHIRVCGPAGRDRMKLIDSTNLPRKSGQCWVSFPARLVPQGRLRIAQDVSPISVNLLGVFFVKPPTKTSS